MDSSLVDSNPVELADIQQWGEASEFELVDRTESESAYATESELAGKGRRYPLKQRKASSRYLANEYIQLADEGEPECYE